LQFLNNVFFFSKKIKLAKQRKALQGAQKPSLKSKLAKPLQLEKSKLVTCKGADEVAPVNTIGDNVSNSSQMLSNLLQSGGLPTTQHTSATSSLINMQSPALNSASNSSMAHSSAVTPSDILLKHILTGSLSAKSEKMDTKPNGPVKTETVVVPKVKPVLPDGLPEALVSKITLLELVCTMYMCVVK